MTDDFAPSVSPLHVLYVEDDEGLATLFKRRMERLGHTTEIAGTGEEGLALFRAKSYDAMVLDYRLPGIDGFDVLREIAPVEGEPPIILLTAGGDEALAVEALKLGAADYLAKDVGQVYLDLVPAVLDAAVTKVRLRRETAQQKDDLRYYVSQLEAEISLRKKSEERLQRSEERLKLALEGTSDGIWDWDMVADKIYFSPRWKEILGYEDHEIENAVESSIELLHPDDREATIARFEAFKKGELDGYQSTFRQRHKNGSWVWILSRAIGIRNEQGELVRMIGGHADITALKSLEVELKQAYDKANAANIAKTDFLANMSHEIRTPMNAVIGLSSILSRTEPLSPQQREYLSTLQLSAQSLLGLLNDLLDITKIEARSIELEQIAFEPGQIIEDIVSMLRIKAHEKDIELTFDGSRIAGIRCLGDPTRFRQVIVNLCGNAIKFTESGGVHIDARCEGEEFVFQIRDTGIGIEPEQLATIFEKFIQADLSITRRYGGSGLGLAITKTLVDLMEGQIVVESEPGLGSVFSVHLPLPVIQPAVQKTNATAPLAAAAPTGQTGDDQTMLLVEDNAANRLVITTYLQYAGYQCDIAVDGAAALEMTSKNRYTIILMDVQMKEIDGLETTRILREREKANGLPPAIIIGMTAHAFAGDRDRCLKAGMSDYLSKPFGQEELTQMLERHAARKTAHA